MKLIKPGDEIPLPHNIEAEQALLGAIMVNNDAFAKVSSIIGPPDFYEPLHGEIFEIMAHLIGAGRVATPITMKSFVSEIDLGGISAPQYLARLCAEATTVINAIDYAKIVKDASVRRALFIACDEMQARILANSPSDAAVPLIDDLTDRIADIRPRQDEERGEFQSFETASRRAMDMAAAAYSQGGVISGLSTGLQNLDAQLGGLNKSDLIIVAGRPGMGKAQPLSARVLTPTGWSTMGRIAIGDRVASIDGKPSVVTGVFPQGLKPVFRVIFKDGRSTLACAEHLWSVSFRDWKTSRTLTTAKLQEMLGRRRYQGRLWIDQFCGEFGGGDPLPIPPWTLGALIAQGTLSRRTPLLTAQPEIASRVASDLGDSIVVRDLGTGSYSLTAAANANGHRPQVRSVLQDSLLALGLFGCHSETVFIPQIYMRADRSARLQLLQGLMDTNGWVDPTPCYVTVSERLANDVASLARSLGYIARIATKQPSFTYRSERRQGQKAFLVWIRADRPSDLVTLPRKIAKVQDRWNGHKRLTIANIEPAGEVECACIAVSHPSHLYVTDDFIVTHNTSLAANIAYNVARDLMSKRAAGEKTGVVAISSLEMSSSQLAQRIVAEHSRISGWRIRRGKVSEAEIGAFADSARALAGLPIRIDQTGGLTIANLAMRVRSLQKRFGVELLVIDYLQLLKGSSSRREANRVQEVTEITTGLKELAKELDIPIIALSQLSRQIESREDKRPMLADLRESGSIEQDADVVLFVYREAYYLKKREPKPGTEAHNEWTLAMEAAHGRAEVIIGKNRHGPEGTVHLGFNADLTQFNDDVPDNELRLPDRASEKRERPKKLTLIKEATVALGILRNLMITASIANDGHVDKAGKGTKLVSYTLWREKCAEELLDSDRGEKAAAALMEKIVKDLRAPASGHPSLIGRGGSKDEPYVWLTEAKD